MKKLLLTTLLFFTSQTFGVQMFDLSSPENKNLQSDYKDCKVISITSFKRNPFGGFKCMRKDGPQADYWFANISSSKSGQQRLYISTPSKCDEANSTDMNSTTVNVNGQNVRFLHYCSSGNIYMTTATEAGDEYVISEFRKKDTVRFGFAEYPVIFDATGFTRQWNNFGGDAL